VLKKILHKKPNSCFFAAIESTNAATRLKLNQELMLSKMSLHRLCDFNLGTAQMGKEIDICGILKLQPRQITFVLDQLIQMHINKEGILCTRKYGNHCFGIEKESEDLFCIMDPSNASYKKYSSQELISEFNDRLPLIIVFDV